MVSGLNGLFEKQLERSRRDEASWYTACPNAILTSPTSEAQRSGCESARVEESQSSGGEWTMKYLILANVAFAVMLLAHFGKSVWSG
jgi:hypothetical protein